jgi:hypothetical protein
VFASLFAKSEWVSGQRPENLKKRKTCFAHSLQMSVFKKWWVRATPDYHYRDFAKAVSASENLATGYPAFNEYLNSAGCSG